MMKEILLYSGGIDSLIAWHYLDKPQRLFVYLGTKYAAAEEANIAHAEDYPSILHRTFVNWGDYEHDDAWLPMRNIFLIMVAAAEGADKIYLVSQKGEQNIPDRSLKFFEKMALLMTEHNERPIEVDPVFPQMDKVAMVKWFLENGYSPQQLVNAYSCYSGGHDPCGQCTACWRKFIALTVNGIECEYIFTHDIREYGERVYRPKLDRYIPERRGSMIEVMRW